MREGKVICVKLGICRRNLVFPSVGTIYLLSFNNTPFDATFRLHHTSYL
jgi:hypothetical protein